MDYPDYNISLDINDIESQVQLYARKGDNYRRITVSLRDHGATYKIEPSNTAVFAITRPGVETILTTALINVKAGTCTYFFDDYTCSIEGLVECELRLLSSSGSIITAPRFTILVSSTVYDDGNVHGTPHNDLLHRDASDCHPISAITSLQSTLNNKTEVSAFNTLSNTVSSNYSTLNGKITTNYTTLDGKISSNYTTLNTRIDSIIEGKAGEIVVQVSGETLSITGN